MALVSVRCSSTPARAGKYEFIVCNSLGRSSVVCETRRAAEEFWVQGTAAMAVRLMRGRGAGAEIKRPQVDT